MSILVTGANGQLGKSIKNLVKINKIRHDFILCTRDQLDLSSLNNIRITLKIKNLM